MRCKIRRIENGRYGTGQKNYIEKEIIIMRLLARDQRPAKFIKKDGTEYDIRANIQSSVNKMITASVNINFEPGDYIERELPNGCTEKYKIMKVNYASDFVNMDIQNMADIPFEPMAQVPVLNIGEVKGHINVNSIVNDYSTNYYSEANEAFFEDMKKAMANTGDDVLRAIDEMQRNIGKKSFAEKYTDFIQVAASYMTLATPFLPMLAECLRRVIG